MGDVRTGRPVGRPRLDRQLHQYNPRVSADIVEGLSGRAQDLGVPLTRYLTMLVSAAHGYTGPYMPEIHPALGIRVPLNELRDRTATRTAAQCIPVPAQIAKRVGVRVDAELARQINKRCRQLGVAYDSYLRSILRDAVYGPSTPVTEQPPLLLSTLREEGAA